MKQYKRGLAALAAAVLVWSALAGTALATDIVRVGGFQFDRDTGEITYAYTLEPILEFPTMLDGIPVVGLADGAYVYQYVEGVVIPDSYTRIGDSAFFQVIGLKEIHFPDSITYLGDGAMNSCSALEQVTLPNAISTLGERLFWQCSSLKEITIPDSVTTIEDAAFGQTGLTRVEIPASVTTIGVSAFGACPNLEEVTVPSSVTSIGDSAFSDCDALTSFTWPASVPVLEDTMFRHCDNLQQVTIPATVTSMGDGVFQFCPKLTDIYYGGTQAQWESLLAGTENYLDKVTVHYGGGSQQPTPPVSDQPSSWAAEQVTAAVAAGIVPQDLQAQYTQAATRAEFCALATALYETATGAEITQRSTFSDTSDPNVEKMAALGVVNGVGNGKFAPDQKLTREQAATMLARLASALGHPLPAQSPTFADTAAISSWAADAVGQMQASGIMGGVGNNAFSPAGDYTREQSILTMLRLFQLVG